MSRTVLEDLEGYDQFMINRIMACNPDTVLLALEGAKYGQLPNESHYLFYFFAVHKKKRYFKYNKQPKATKDLTEAAMRLYGLNRDDATVMISLLSDEEINNLKEFKF